VAFDGPPYPAEENFDLQYDTTYGAAGLTGTLEDVLHENTGTLTITPGGSAAPAPAITILSPPGGNSDWTTFTMFVGGSNFGQDAVVEWTSGVTQNRP
jgi:hypothetical protein